MKIKSKSVICMLLILAIVIVIMPKSQAAGLVISFSKSTANVGDTVTVTVTGSGISGRADLSVSGNATLSQNSVFVDNGSASVTATINGAGSIRITATAVDMADSSTADPYTGSTGGTITATSASSGSSSSSSGNSSSGSSSSGSSTSGNTGTSTTQSPSSNANLSNLGIRPNDFTGFRPATTTYNVTVPEDVESVEVYATASDSKATIAGTGNKTLQYGANALNVVVTAENGTTKTYTINVTREGTEENAEEQPEEDTENTEVVNGLSNITIKDLELKPAFSSDIYEYTVDYIGEATSLDIQAVATDPSYTVEILGNEELKEGENTITILVSDTEGNNVATYQLTVNKSLVDEEALAREEEQKQQEEQRRMFMIAGGIIALILIIVIIIIIKRRRNRVYAEEFSGVPFAGINDEDDYYDDYNSNDQYDDYDNVDTQNNQFPEEENQATYIEHSGDTKNAQDYDNVQENETLQKPKFLNNPIEDKELQEKERAKQAFLNGYNTDGDYDYDNDYEDEKTRKRKKGKRFK